MAKAKGIPLMGRGPDGEAKIINVDENGNVKAQLTGSVRQIELVFPTANRTTSEKKSVVVPDRAIGFIAMSRTYGTVGVNPLIGIKTGPQYSENPISPEHRVPFVVSTEMQPPNATCSHAIVWYPGAQIVDGVISPGQDVRFVSAPLGPRQYFELVVTGDFSTGGFTSRMEVYWIMA